MPTKSKFVPPSPVDPNPNTSWVPQTKVVWIFYIIALFISRAIVGALFSTTSAHAWTVVNVAHAFCSFYLLHWIKGVPIEGSDSQGKYDKLTFFEQIDQQRQFTTTKKFLLAVPVGLYILTLYKIGNDPFLLILNTAASAVVIIGKLPFMHRVRILGIND
eukprot:TRINITY_DN610_c0_g1_i1.p1 TRINITY_DN610_c0_g1~~TRINITY_DN610_c0_g1_i1.p1  ORF type:complete len:160 (-),score=23.33 TRINITY_DN610_c0_g1_i1:99-578(-)